MARERLTRDPDNEMLGGVCAGIARYYDIDVTLIRIVWLVLTVISAGTSIIVYIAAWVIIPLPSEDEASAGQERGEANRPLEHPGDTLPARERVVESGRVLLTHTRESVQEIARIARGERASNAGAEAPDSPAPGVKATTPDSGAPAAPQPPSQPGASQPFSAGDTPTSADPPVDDDNPAPPPQSPV